MFYSDSFGTNHIDLLVLGTHGHTGLPKLVMGSVAERILGQSPIPVLTIGPHVLGERRAKNFSRIVFVTDLSGEFLGAMPHAMALVQDHDGHLTVLHVLNGTSKATVDFEARCRFRVAPDAGTGLDRSGTRNLSRLCSRVCPGGRTESSILRGTRCGHTRAWRARAAWPVGKGYPSSPYNGAAHRRAGNLSRSYRPGINRQPTINAEAFFNAGSCV